MKNVWLLALVTGLWAVFGAVAGGGYSRVYEMGGDGAVCVRNGEANSVWRPCAVAVVCPDAVARTVTVWRVTGSLEYPVSTVSESARSFVYFFEGSYWSGLSNGVKVTVSPACTGVVEVVVE